MAPTLNKIVMYHFRGFAAVAGVFGALEICFRPCLDNHSSKKKKSVQMARSYGFLKFGSMADYANLTLNTAKTAVIFIELHWEILFRVGGFVQS